MSRDFSRAWPQNKVLELCKSVLLTMVGFRVYFLLYALTALIIGFLNFNYHFLAQSTVMVALVLPVLILLIFVNVLLFVLALLYEIWVIRCRVWEGLLPTIYTLLLLLLTPSIVISIFYIYVISISKLSAAQATAWLQGTPQQFSFILITEALTLGGLYVYLRYFKIAFKAIGLRRPRWRDVAYGLLAAPVYYVIYLLTVGVVSYFVPALNVNQTQEIGFTNVHGAVALTMTFISLVVLPPLTEEILIRGFLYSSLKKGMPTLAAVFVTSAIFASAHLPEGGAAGPLYIAALDTFVLSLVLIYLREKTGSLWGSITLHAIKNGVAFVALFILSAR